MRLSAIYKKEMKIKKLQLVIKDTEGGRNRVTQGQTERQRHTRHR